MRGRIRLKRSLQGVLDLLNTSELRASFYAVYRGRGTDAQKKRVLFSGAILALIFLIIFLMIPSDTKTMEPVSHGTPVYFTVRPGMTVSDIGTALHARGIIDSEFKFWWTAKLNGFENKVKSGTFAMETGMTARDALEILVYGNTAVIRFTIPEGFSVRDIADRLEQKGIVQADEFMTRAEHYRPYSYVEEHDEVRYAAEGFLFPDTYEINDSISVDTILKMMAENFDHRLTKEMRTRAAEMNLSIYDLVTLASIVEKEAYHDEDRPIIAQIFLKRLQIGMPLQADPTIQYLLNQPKEDLLLRDTEIDSPYNTYQNGGLPPGPIANPGTASIMAVLYPADTNYLYFVADRNGNNYYATNYADHLALVEQVR